MNSGSPLTSLVPSVLSALSSEDTPILAAGGLANGAHLASMLALGASGAVFGTRFLLSEESLYSAHQKQALKSATSASATVRTMSFDEVSLSFLLLLVRLLLSDSLALRYLYELRLSETDAPV